MANYPVEKKKLRGKFRNQSRAIKLARKLNARQLKEAEKKHDTAVENAKNLKEKLASLQQLKTEMEHVTEQNGGILVTMANEVPSWVNGIWIVARRDEDKVLFFKFFEFIREIKDFKRWQLDLPKDRSMVGEDGKEVTFNKGDLLQVVHRPDVLPGKHGFHFANVGPNGPEGQLQLELALHRLGMGPVPCADPKTFLVVDGSFRKVN